MAKRPPPSEATREKNRQRERYRRINAKRRADPEYRQKERRATAERMRRLRDDPVYRERSREVVRLCHERYRVDRQFDAFMRSIEAGEPS